jgi:hypothetical protein
MNDLEKPKNEQALISRRQVLRYGLSGIAGFAGGILPALAYGETNLIHGTQTEGRPHKASNYHSSLCEAWRENGRYQRAKELTQDAIAQEYFSLSGQKWQGIHEDCQISYFYRNSARQ